MPDTTQFPKPNPFAKFARPPKVAGPWDDFQTQPAASEGPWTQYASPSKKTATLRIGNRTVKVDDSFLSQTPAEQQRTVDEIENSITGGGRREPGSRSTCAVILKSRSKAIRSWSAKYEIPETSPTRPYGRIANTPNCSVIRMH